VVAHALATDRFGNVTLDVTHDDLIAAGLQLGHRLELQCAAERHVAQYARTFVDVAAGELLVYEDAYRTLAVAINRGDAAETLQLAVDSELVIRPT